MSSIAVYFLPEEIPRGALRGSVAIAIDVLRASTTILTSLANGARGVYPCLTVEQAQSLSSELGDALLGGERNGQVIAGFQLGNSPSEYGSETVAQKSVVFTTTNGTRALLACSGAVRVCVASFVNRAAVCEQLAGTKRISIVCAGTDGVLSGEDILFAGSLCDLLSRDGKTKLNVKARVAREIWRTAHRRLERGASLYELLAETRGGRNLLKLGFQDDIQSAATIDRFNLVAEYDPSTRCIRDVTQRPPPR